jgi:hypothetical protein
MKNENDFTFRKAILYGLLTELVLIAIQFIYMKLYVSNNPETELGFTTDYMKYRGFYVFQIIGFFVYTILVFVLVRNYQIKSINKILAFVMAGAVVELGFYLLIQSDYEFAFFYSILDRFIAAIFGTIVYYYAGNKPTT